MINVKVQGELLNYGYLQVPYCNVCGAFISKCSQVRKESWVCQVCRRQLKLPNWYREQPINLDEFQIVQTAPKFIRRVVFLIDISSRTLCQMIIPLIESSDFDEIAIIACTPYPTIIEFKNKIKMVTLVDDQEYKLDIFMNCKKDFQKIRSVCRMLEKLCQQSVLKSNYPVEVAQQFLNRLLDYQQIKIIHFSWISQFSKPPQDKIVNIGKNHYHLFIIDESNTVNNYYQESTRRLHGKCEVFSHDDLDSFYERVENILSGKFCWEAQLSVILGPGLKIAKFQNYLVESNIFYLPYLSNKDEIELELGYESQSKSTITRAQTILSYQSGDQRITAVKNLIL